MEHKRIAMDGAKIGVTRRRRITEARASLAVRYEADPDSISRFNARMARLSAARRNQRTNAKRWCILRTSSRSTISLAESLEQAGFETWTPIAVAEKRISRARDRVEILSPLMPSFVFASADGVSDLFRLSADPLKRHVDFSVFHFGDRVPVISDRELETLRDIEGNRHSARILRERRQKHRAEPIAVGQVVRISEGPFGGLEGIVEESNGRDTVMCFGGMKVKVDTFILRSDVIAVSEPDMGAAA